MATLTIRCGPSHNARRPANMTMGNVIRYQNNHNNQNRVKAQVHRRAQLRSEKHPGGFNQRYYTKETNSRKAEAAAIQGPAVAVAIAPRGAWGNGRFRPSNQRVTELRRATPQLQTTTVAECHYCHHDHHISVCPKLAEKNRRNAEWADNEAAAKKARKAEMAHQKRERAEALLAERVRKSMEKKNPEPVEEDSESESDSSDEEEEEQTLRRRVTFANDSDCLMKPEPTHVKEFDTTEPATAVSSDEEDTSADASYFASKRSAGAWQPRRREAVPHEDSTVAKLKKELAEMEKELAGMGNDSWADACDIDDLEEDIDDIKKQLRHLLSADSESIFLA
jgi:hypothetical protein